MARTRHATYRKTRRAGGGPVNLLVLRTWADYAVHCTSHGETLDALYDARKQPDDVLTVRLSETAAEALIEACERRRRVRTAEAFREALKIALTPPEEVAPMDHLRMLAELGELEPEELEMLRGAMGDERKGLF